MSKRQYQGLYDPQYEHDACGVGMVADFNGQKSHHIIRSAIRVLINLEHRGACGCDPETGDGAGILSQLPHDFFKRQCGFEGITLPSPGAYGVGMVFLPRDPEQRQLCEQIIEQTVWDESQVFLGWRDVPVDHSQIGRVAHEVSPMIRQFFVSRDAAIEDDSQFERKLFVIRKVIESTVDGKNLEDGDDFYIALMQRAGKADDACFVGDTD